MGTRTRVALMMLGGLALISAACTQPSGGGGNPGPTNQVPIAVALGTPVSGNVPLTVAFDGSNSVDPDGTVVSHAWNFGNSTTGSGPATSATYTSPGVYTVVLTVTDNGGATDTDSITITVQGDGDGDGYFVPADCNDADGTIHPGAPDPIDDEIDQNCDGIDGEETNAVFVSSATGDDTSICGPITAPCETIGFAESRAGTLSKTKVYVAGGSYPSFTVVAGLEIRGGFGQNWHRGLTATGSTIANVTASFDAGVGGPVGIIASGVTSATTVADLKVTGVAAAAGQTSYGVFVTGSSSLLVLDSLNIVGGTGGIGSNGSPGNAGWGSAATAGSGGGNGFEPGGTCNTSSAGGGGAGAGGGGNGGKGGEIDTNCGVFSLDLDAQPGDNGGNASTVSGAFGLGGAGGVGADEGFPWVCTISGGNPVHGTGGNPGQNGSAGSGGAGGPAGANGGTGGLGSVGTPGGGGGGGGGNDCNIDDAGAGGGGGGAGGARASSAGTGGVAGRPAIGLRLQSSTPTLISVTITLGVGGKGGDGGPGAPGQPGGAGGAGGAAFDRGGAGGAGGAGGTGGASGAGGGGGGGNAIGMSLLSSTPVGTPTFSGGSGGAGGSGGNPGSSGTVVHIG